MENPLTQPVVCPIVVGRTAELTALRLLVDRTKDGSGQVLLLHGEAGIGKSRLVAEVKASAADQGFLLLQGNCFQGDHSAPYAALLDLFRTQFLAPSPRTPVPSDLQPLAQALSRILPELPLLMPELASAPALPPSDPEQEKRRLFAAVSHFFATQARRQPVLLIIEDLHWSDEASLEILLHLVRACTALPFLFVLTYRAAHLFFPPGPAPARAGLSLLRGRRLVKGNRVRTARRRTGTRSLCTTRCSRTFDSSGSSGIPSS
ncbi:MAG: ATP-binding protein [Ktedonobacteraceae bacterium]|nr:ATP-binding protein [Ktedonobacteraceae bacterium]